MPRRYACIACGRLTPNPSSLCDEHLDYRKKQRAARDATPAQRARRSHDNRSYRGPLWNRVRRIVIDRDGCCQQCGSEEDLTADHIIPITNGGEPLDEDNLQCLCRSCNAGKGAR